METTKANLVPDPFASTSKQELDAAKAGIEEQLTVLQTQAGADAFIAKRITACQDVIAKTIQTQQPATRPDRITMRDYLCIEQERAERFPAAVVEQECLVLENRSRAIGRALIEIDDKPTIKDPAPGVKEGL